MTWKENAQQVVYSCINPIVRLFIKVGITPNMITFFGFILNLAAAIILIFGAEYGDRSNHSFVGIAGLVILFAGLMDMVDGRLARLGNMANKYGALYDSVIDRFSEMYMFLGICYYLVSHDYFLSSIFAFIAMIGSIMVSYTRARAEGLGVDCSVGIMQRPERILIVGISAVLCGITSMIIGSDFKINVDWLPFPLFETISVFTFPLFILAIGANMTAFRRLAYAKEELAKMKKDVI
jgi:phosphatidylglycerophosphate synthase